MHDAAERGQTVALALLAEFGAGVNAPRHPGAPERPIGTALRAEHLDNIRWLLAHGRRSATGGTTSRPTAG